MHKSMIKVYNIISWNENIVNYNLRLELQKPNDFNFFDITLNINEADVICIQDNISSNYMNAFNNRNLNSKVFLFEREPSYLNLFNSNLKSHADKIITYDKNICFVRWWLNYNYNELTNLKYNDLTKDKEYVCVTSNKHKTHGQKTRYDWLLKHQNDFNIDFYGKPKLKDLFKNYKGLPESYCNKEGINRSQDKSILGQYHKSFSFENGKQKNFITRVNEDLLMWTLPLYWGCSNIDEIYPKNSYRYIDIEKPLSKELIEIINEPVSKDEMIAIEEARLLVLNKYNWWVYVKEIIEQNF